MKRSRLFTLGAFVAAIGTVLVGLSAPAPALAASTLVFTTFKGDSPADEELWVYQSTDGGQNYSVLSDTNFQGPTGELRDPSITKLDGVYYVAYTPKRYDEDNNSFNIASSTNLTTWTNIATVPAGVANTNRAWAPEFFIDNGVVKIITSISTTACDKCFTPYVYTAQNAGLTSWSAPVAMGGIPTNHIDTFVVKVGSTYHAYTKDENAKNIEHWTSNSLTSGWTNQGVKWSGYEGPALVKLDDGSWRIYIDKYPSGGMWTATSTDLSNWSGLTQVGCSGCRHGTAINP